MTCRDGTARLGASRTSFVGRVDELRTIQRLYAEENRLVTLLGPGGAGKTRLAQHFASEVAPRAEVCFCDLTEARSLDDILSRVGAALGVTLATGVSSAAVLVQLGHAIAARPTAIVLLDNFEHVASHAATTVGAWLDHPGARFLVTSRVRLGLLGEVGVEVSSLAPEHALELFEHRARAVVPGFTVDGSARLLVSRLEGSPLAIELAAARVNVLPPKKLLERFAKHLDLLTSARTDIPPRHASLRAAIDGSWDLLDAEERDTLAQCSVFHGGFTLDAAESVVEVSGRPVDETLGALIEKSLLLRHESPEPGSEVRFRLYESVREYGRDMLDASGRTEATRARATEYYLDLGERWAAGDGRHTAREQRRAMLEMDNLLEIFRRSTGLPAARAALCLDSALATCFAASAHVEILSAGLEQARSGGDARVTVALLCARGDAFRREGKLADASADLERAVELAVAASSAKFEARALSALAMLECARGRFSEAQAAGQRAFATAKNHGNHQAEANALFALGWSAKDVGHVEEAERYAELGLSIATRHELLVAEGHLRTLLASVNQYLGAVADATLHLERALETARCLGLLHAESALLGNLANLLTDAGRHADADIHYAGALDLVRRMGFRHAEGFILANLVSHEHDRGRLAEARAHADRALELFREVGDERMEAVSLRALGRIDLEEGHVERALERIGRSHEWARSKNQSLVRTYSVAWLGACEASRDDIDAARAHFATARSLSEGLVERGHQATLSTLESLLEVTLARRARAAGDTMGAAAHAREADRLVGLQSMGASSVQVRIAQRISRRARAALGSLPEGKIALEIGPEARWFARDDTRVDLSRRRALRRLLLRLSRAHHEAPGAPLSIRELFEAGWPNERVRDGAATRRVYTSIGLLRDFGLRDLLVRVDDGYMLSPPEGESIRLPF